MLDDDEDEKSTLPTTTISSFFQADITPSFGQGPIPMVRRPGIIGRQF